jgi:hypothetical protein
VTSIDAAVWLVSGYAAFLVLVAHGFDRLARRVSRRAESWRTGAFTYHADHDAWVCPENQWLWPVSFNEEQRVMRYRASPVVCNSCPVKSTCTTSPSGREIAREVDPWPHSEAGRFHRGIACAIALIAVLLPLGEVVGSHEPPEVAVLLSASFLVVLTSLPLVSHLRRTPTGFPVHVPLERLPDAPAGPAPASAAHVEPEAPADRFATRWGGFDSENVERGAGWSRVRRS